MSDIVERLAALALADDEEDFMATAHAIEEIETLRQRVMELEKIERVANCNTVDSFLSLPDADKRKWFAISVEDSTRRKHAEEELTAEREVSDKLEKALKTICANTADDTPPFRCLGVSGPVKSIACASIMELAAMRKGETE